MTPAPSACIPDGLLAAMPQLREKLHLGVPSSNPALYLGFSVCKSTTALGLQAALHLERVQSRSTGKERDTESGNDYFGARYYASSMGRWLSPDPKIISKQRMFDPQQWNMYSYVRNNPLIAIDPDGRELKIVVLNTGGYNATTSDHVAKFVQGKFQNAGVLNVTYQVINGPSFWQTLKADLFSGAHTKVMELAKGPGQEKGDVKIGSSNGHPDIGDNVVTTQQDGSGRHGNESVVNGGAVDAAAGQGEGNVTALGNTATHEVAHDVLDHNDSSPIMNPSDTPQQLNDPNRTFTPQESQKLKDAYNRPGEKEHQ